MCGLRDSIQSFKVSSTVRCTLHMMTLLISVNEIRHKFFDEFGWRYSCFTVIWVTSVIWGNCCSINVTLVLHSGLIWVNCLLHKYSFHRCRITKGVRRWHFSQLFQAHITCDVHEWSFAQMFFEKRTFLSDEEVLCMVIWENFTNVTHKIRMEKTLQSTVLGRHLTFFRYEKS